MAGREMRPQDTLPLTAVLFRRLRSGLGHCEMTATSSTTFITNEQAGGLTVLVCWVGGGARPPSGGPASRSGRRQPLKPVGPVPGRPPATRHCFPAYSAPAPCKHWVVRACLGNQGGLRGPFQLVIN